MAKLHWTQRPENRAKVLANAAKGGKTAHKLKPMNDIAIPLIEKHKELQMQVQYRINEIDRSLEELQNERKQLVDIFNLGNE
jgi:hypothetical protein